MNATPEINRNSSPSEKECSRLIRIELAIAKAWREPNNVDRRTAAAERIQARAEMRTARMTERKLVTDWTQMLVFTTDALHRKTI